MRQESSFSYSEQGLSGAIPMKDMGVLYEDATAFRKGDRWGYIHKSGEIYVEPEFASAGRMSKDGKAYVTLGSAWQIRLLIAGEESITDE